jgi:hypothetical protein
MMRKWLKRIFVGFGVIALAIVMFVGLVIFEFWYTNNYKSHIQTLESTDYNIQFFLLTDMSGFGDPAWYVYQTPIGASITRKMKNGHDDEEGVLFWNYSEAGDHSYNAKIELYKKKFLVFSRGDFYYSLYNVETKQVIVNDLSPWHSFRQADEANKPSSNPMTQEERNKKMDNWVQKNLHLKIEKILNNAS